MNTTARNALLGYGAFCAVNWAVTYFAARSGSPLLFGSAQLLTLNESLRRVNVLSYLVDPLTVAQHHAAAATAHPAAGMANQQFLPGSQTVSQYASGATTTFG